jgi:signal transduction histidine kinase
VFLLIGVGIATLRTGDLRARSEAAAAIRAELVAESVVAPLLRPGDLDGPIRGARYAALDRAIHEFAMEEAGVERVKIWNPAGMVVFSNDRAQVGLRPELEEDLHEALEGELASEISDLDEPENASERKLADQLFETYVPVSLAGGSEEDRVDAVVEIYQDYSSIQLEIDRLNDILTISLGTGLVVLYVLLLPLVVGATRTLRRQNAQLGEQETVAELRELDRLKSDFVAAASHELRTPLTTIRGFAELLRERGAPDQETRDAVETITRQTAHLQRLVGNLLREAQLEHGEVPAADELTSVARVLEEVREAFPGATGRIDVRVADDVPPVALDAVALHEIVANLVDNGLKYSQPGATVGVTAAIEDGAFVCRVTDRGEGIAAGDLPRIFERFTQVDQTSTRAHGGVGLGLHLVRELTRRMGGDVSVESAIGTGTTFTVRIPVGPPASLDGSPTDELSHA